MARKKKPPPPPKTGAWLTTFNDLMTLLLTFFVLLLSMGSLEGGKIAAAVSELNSALGVMGSGQYKEYPIFNPIARVLLYGKKYKEVQHIHRSVDEDVEKEAHQITRPISREGTSEGDSTEPSGVVDGNGSGAGDGGQAPSTEAFEGAADTKAVETVKTTPQDEAVKKQLQKIEDRAETLSATIDGLDYQVDANRDITLKMPGEVLFDVGETDIKSAARPMLDEIAAIIANANGTVVVVTGHTDDTPIHTASFPSNWELSVGRASEVLRYLARKSGVDPSRFMASGYGSSRAVAFNDSEDSRKLNRRVEIKLINKR